jgi:hypothetical protein
VRSKRYLIDRVNPPVSFTKELRDVGESDEGRDAVSVDAAIMRLDGAIRQLCNYRHPPRSRTVFVETRVNAPIAEGSPPYWAVTNWLVK